MSNTNRRVNSELFITQIITKISNKFGRNLISTERDYVLQLIKSINPVVLNKRSLSEISEIIVNKVIDEITNQQCGIDDDINIHEVLKNEIGVPTKDTGLIVDKSLDNVTTIASGAVSILDIFGTKSLPDLVKIINPTVINKTAYILLDSRYRILDTDGTISFSWNFVNNTNLTQGSVNVIGDIKDVTSIKVFPVKIPYTTNADNIYGRITMFIQEFSAQAFIAQENTKFHFVFATDVQDRFIELNPKDNNLGLFQFKNPISHVETLTISFGSPLQPIVFDTDRQNMSISSYNTVTSFTSPYMHNLLTGDIVYISNFVTYNPSRYNTTINAVNNTSGNIISYIDDYTFSIDVDTTVLYAVSVGTVNAVNGDTNITGNGTMFTTLFANDNTIVIYGFISGTQTITAYEIANVVSDTELNLVIPYQEDTNVDLVYQSNNTITDIQMPVYFGSKRVFIAMELHYNESSVSI